MVERECIYQKSFWLQIIESPDNNGLQANRDLFFSHNKSGGGWHWFRQNNSMP